MCLSHGLDKFAKKVKYLPDIDDLDHDYYCGMHFDLLFESEVDFDGIIGVLLELSEKIQLHIPLEQIQVHQLTIWNLNSERHYLKCNLQ